MRTETIRRVGLLACALAIFANAPCATGQNAPAAKASTNKAVPTVAEAKRFLDEAEQRYFELTNKAQRVQWVQGNFITDDTEEIGADANQELNAFSAEMSKIAHRFDGMRLPADMARKMLLLKLSTTFPALRTRKRRKSWSR